MTVSKKRPPARTFPTAVPYLVSAASGNAALLQAGKDEADNAEAERVFQRQERRYLELVPLALFILDKEGRCLFANRKAARLFNASPGQLEQLFILDFLSPLPNAPEQKTWAALTRSERFSINAVLRYSLGLPAPVLLEAQQVGDKYFACCKKTVPAEEIQSRDQEWDHRFQFIQKMARLGLWEWHVAAGIIHLSAGMQQVLSLPLDSSSFAYEALDDLVHPSDRARLKEAFPIIPLVEDGCAEVRALARDGCWTWVSTHGHVVERNEAGIPLRYMGVITDITDRKQHEQESALFFQISHAIHTTRTLKDFFSLLFDLLAAGLSTAELEVALFEIKPEETSLLFYKNTQDDELPRGPESELAPSAGLVEVMRSGQSASRASGKKAGDEKNRSWLGLPLLMDGAVIGGIAVSRPAAMPPFTLREQNLLHTVAEQAALGIERKRNEERLAHLALYDSLTGLPNRVLFRERAQRGRQRAQRRPDMRCALMLLDIDHFKAINDTYGHKAGDDALQGVARIVLPLLRNTDIVARLGGDEFAIFLEDIPTATEALAIARRVLNGLKTRIPAGGTFINCSASMGIVLNAQLYDSVDHMLEDADAALYRVKECKRGRMRVFTPALRNSFRRRRNMERLLSAALPAQQFRLFMQPAFTLHDSCLYYMEMLLRWSPKPDTFLSPRHFLSRAESLGLTRQLDQWALETVCEMLRNCGPSAGVFRNVPISVNISPTSAVARDFPATALSIVENAGLLPGALRIEFPEQALAAAPRKAQANITALAEAGFPILLDGFGTSHAPLHLLHNLPLTALKFSPSSLAIQQQSHNAPHFLRTLAFFAAELMVDTVSVGIETRVQQQLAADLGCKAVQGYLFQPPLPLEEIRGFMASWRKETD